MRALRVLIVAHGHPDLYVGGGEVFAYELFRGLREVDGLDVVFLARTFESGHRGRPGTPFRAHRGRPDEILWFPGEHDDFFQTLLDKSEYSVAFRELLESWRPHVVHVQHTSGLGFGVLREIRRAVPDSALVYTLHEFIPICHARGLMIRRDNGELCSRADPVDCHRCFPAIPAVKFLLRERGIRAELERVDRFVTPSEFLRRRFIEWGLSGERILFEPNGRLPLDPLPGSDAPPIGHFAFLGQIAAHKGLTVLLEAMRRLHAEGLRGVRLFIHGSGLEHQPEAYRQELHERLGACRDSVTFAGPYATADLPRLLRDVAWVVVPSTWWENSPMVIQEAFALGRPVLCSDVGGMAEKVRDGVDGLHFRTGDAASLATAIRRAAGSPELWRELRRGIRPVHTMKESIAFHVDLYRSLLEPAPAVPSS